MRALAVFGGPMLTLAAVLVLPAQSNAVKPQTPWIPPGQAGITICRHDTAESWIRADVATTSDEAQAVLAHEAVHRAQAKRAGSCDAFFASINTPELYIEVEVEAYCAQLRILERTGRHQAAELREGYVDQIASDAGPGTLPLVWRRFDRDCPRATTVSASR